MEFIQGGVGLSEVLLGSGDDKRLLCDDLGDNEVETIYRQYIGFLLQLFKLNLPSIVTLQLDRTDLRLPPRPLTWKAHDILATGGVDAFGDRSKGFSSTTEYFSYILEQDWEQLQGQPNSACSEKDARGRYRNMQALRALLPRFVHKDYDQSHFKLICDDLGLGNLIIRSREDLTIIGVVDFEWSYGGPAQLFGTAPWWLLFDRPINDTFDYDDGKQTKVAERYFRYLDIFKRVLEEEEAVTPGHEGREFSKLVRWSQESGAMWFHMLLSAAFNGEITFPFTKLIEHVGREEWERLRKDVNEEDVIEFGIKKKKDLDDYRADKARMKAEVELVEAGKMSREEFVKQNWCEATSQLRWLLKPEAGDEGRRQM